MRLFESQPSKSAFWKFHYMIRTVLLFSGIVLCLAAFSLAQVDPAGLRGTVTDPFSADHRSNCS